MSTTPITDIHKEIELEYKVEEKDFIHFSFSAFRSSKYKFILILIVGIFLFSTIMDLILWSSKTDASIDIRRFLPLLFFIALFGYLYFRTKKTYQNNSYFHNPMKINLNPQEINFSGKGYDMTMDWSKILKVISRQNYYLFYTSEQIANIVSKSSISEKDQHTINQILEQVSDLNYIQK